MIKKRLVYFFLIVFFCLGFSSASFNSTWNTSAISMFSSDADQITLPLEDGGSYSFTVYWGDGESSFVDEWDSVNKTHTYAIEGVYNISIGGLVQGFSFGPWGVDSDKIINITEWGLLMFANNGSYFRGCKKFRYSNCG